MVLVNPLQLRIFCDSAAPLAASSQAALAALLFTSINPPVALIGAYWEQHQETDGVLLL